MFLASYLLNFVIWNFKQRISPFDFMFLLKVSFIKNFPIMLALCFMLSSPYYAENYAGIIDTGLVCACAKVCGCVCMCLHTVCLCVILYACSACTSAYVHTVSYLVFVSA